MIDQPERETDIANSEPPAASEPAQITAAEHSEANSISPVKIHQQENTANDADHSDQERPVTRGELADRIQKSDRWMIGLTAVIAIGGAVSAIIFGYQLHEMKIAADLTREGIEISRRALESSQRAWLAPMDVIAAPPSLGVELYYAVLFRNIGKEPATNVIATGDAGFTKRTPQDRGWSDLETAPNKTCELSFEGSDRFVAYPSEDKSRYAFNYSIAPENVDKDLLAAKKTFFVQGCIKYESAGKSHFTRYCYYLHNDSALPVKDWRFRLCTTGNDGD